MSVLSIVLIVLVVLVVLAAVWFALIRTRRTGRVLIASKSGGRRRTRR